MTNHGTVFIVDDDPAIQESLSWLMESVGLKNEGFMTAEGFLDAYTPSRCGCLLLDVRMPGLSGLDLQRRLKHRGELIPVIIMTGHADASMAVAAMKAGAFDFIEKPIDNDAILDSIRRAMEVDQQARRQRAELDDIRACFDTLSRCEREVMDLVIEGMTNQEIARHLHRSIKTIETHRKHVMTKMKSERLAILLRKVLALHAAG